MLPKGYGLCYIDWPTHRRIIYPFPLNHIVYWCLEIWWRIRNVPVKPCRNCDYYKSLCETMSKIIADQRDTLDIKDTPSEVSK